MDFLRITNWDRWQSYRKDRGQPPWIKIHRCVMRNPEWVSLTDADRGQLVSMWLLAADHDGVIPASPELIQKLCYMSSLPNLIKFKELCFIDGDVTPMCRQDDANTTNQNRIEKNREEKKRPDAPQKNAAYSDDFLSFWGAYPNKTGKGGAYKSWKKYKPNLTVCLKAIKDQTAEKIRLKSINAFCPEWKNPSTWLNNACWEDETAVEAKAEIKKCRICGTQHWTSMTDGKCGDCRWK